jgi:hypothetical protein
MSKAPRFTHRIDTWFNQETAEWIEAISEQRQMTASAVVREMVAACRQSMGMAPPPRSAMNGQHHQERTQHAV